MKKRNSKFKKLILGGAQIGMQYGIRNRKKMLSIQEVEKVFIKYKSLGVSTIDTALSYGKSEKIIGNILKKNNLKFKVITKLPKYNKKKAKKNEIKKFVLNSIKTSCKYLQVDFLDVLLLHNYSDFFLHDGYIFKCLLDLKKKGYIKNIGASIQSTEELNLCLKNKYISYIQLPFNLLDHRWASHIHKINLVRKKRKLFIHCRSVFLKGLLLTDNKNLWKNAHIANSKKIIEELNQICKKLKVESVYELCIRYVFSQKWIDSIIIGTIRYRYISKNIKYILRPNFSNKEINLINSLISSVSNLTLDPKLWKLNEK